MPRRRRPARLPRRHDRAARGGRGAGGLDAPRGRVGRRRAGRAACASGARWPRSTSRGRSRRAAVATAALTVWRPRAVLYSTTTAALLGPCPGAIRFDAPAAGNRPGPARDLAAAASSAAGSPPRRCCCRGAPAGWPRRRRRTRAAVVVPVAVAPSGPARRPARPRRGHLRRQPGEEGARSRAGRVARGAARRRDAGGRRRWRRATRPGCASPGMLARGRVPRAAAARAACSSPRRGARTTGSRSSRRWPTAAGWSPTRRRGRTRRCRSRAGSTRGWSATTWRARSGGARRSAPGLRRARAPRSRRTRRPPSMPSWRRAAAGAAGLTPHIPAARSAAVTTAATVTPEEDRAAAPQHHARRGHAERVRTDRRGGRRPRAPG